LEERERPLQRATPKQGQLRRGIYLLPSLFTVGTLVCGYFAILKTLQGAGILATSGDASTAFDYAARGIGWAIVFDGLDGRIARLTNASSDFGREFDSLADVITFGLAPALLAYTWGIHPMQGEEGPTLLPRLLQIGWGAAFAFLICGAARLARFNIDTGKPTADRRYFIGLPIPAAAGLIAACVHFFRDPITDWYYGIAWVCIVATLAFLMVSRLRYPSFKNVDLRRPRPYVTIILLGIIVYGIWQFSRPALLILAMTYSLSGPVGRIASKLRPPPPAPEEVHAS
jgi:CDP-diacylglycerol---serine O-phosphatidyltransferase